MKRLWLIIFVIIGCSKEKEYDYSRIKIAPENYYEALAPEMFDGNKLGDKIFVVESIHHKDVAYIGAMVFGEGIESGYPCVWAKTGGIDGYGLWFSLNKFSKFFPEHDNMTMNHCCATAIKKFTKSYYINNNPIPE